MHERLYFVLCKIKYYTIRENQSTHGDERVVGIGFVFLYSKLYRKTALSDSVAYFNMSFILLFLLEMWTNGMGCEEIEVIFL